MFSALTSLLLSAGWIVTQDCVAVSSTDACVLTLGGIVGSQLCWCTLATSVVGCSNSFTSHNGPLYYCWWLLTVINLDALVFIGLGPLYTP